MMKPKQLIHFLVFLLLSVFIYSCDLDLGERGNGQIITEEYEVGNFNSIEFAGNFEVVLRESSQPKLIIMTDENLINYIEVDNNGGTLEIRSRRKLRPSDNSRVIVEYTELERVDVSGAASLEAENTLTGDDFELFMSGAGEVDLDVDLKSIRVDISGAGAVELQGLVRDMKVSMSGAGGFDGEELRSENCDVSISGVGGASVYVTNELNATVSGVGGVSYRGNPETINKNVSGLGSIDSSDDDDSM